LLFAATATPRISLVRSALAIRVRREYRYSCTHQTCLSFLIASFATLFEPGHHANFGVREFASTRWIVARCELIVT
jgi:hypothetical protein